MDTVPLPSDLQHRLARALPEERPALLLEYAQHIISADTETALHLCTVLHTDTTPPSVRAEACLVAARCLHHTSRNTESISYAVQAQELFRESGNSDGEARALYIEGFVRHSCSDYTGSLDLLSRAAYLHHQAGNSRAEADATRTRGLALMRLGRYDEAREALATARTVFAATGDTTGYIATGINIGNAAYLQGHYDAALEHYTAALAASEQANEPDLTARTLLNASNVYEAIGDYDRAIDCLERTLALCRNDNSRRSVEANALVNLGIMYINMKEYPQALACFNRSLEHYRAQGHRLNEANALNNIGNVYQYLGDYSIALAYYRQSLDLFRDTGNRTGEFDAVYNIGLCHGYLGETATALDYYRQSLHIAASVGEQPRQAWVLLGIGRLLLHDLSLGDSAEAIRYLHEALALAGHIGSKSTLHEIHEVLSGAYERTGDYQQSLHHYREFHRLKAEVFSEEADSRLKHLTVRFQVEKAQQEREVFRLKSERLEQEMEFRIRELAAMALHLVERNEFLERIRPAVHSIARGTDASPADTARTLLRQIDDMVSTRHDWEVFNEQLQELGVTFIEKLTRRFPALTPTEIKVCSLLKIQLSTKDIAHLMHITTRAVEKHRYQIRKKLGLASDANLATFFAAL